MQAAPPFSAASRLPAGYQQATNRLPPHSELRIYGAIYVCGRGDLSRISSPTDTYGTVRINVPRSKEADLLPAAFYGRFYLVSSLIFVQ
jgi:hypothetical protein